MSEQNDKTISWDEALERVDDAPSNPRVRAGARLFSQRFGLALNRREALMGAAAAGLAGCATGAAPQSERAAGAGAEPRFDFVELETSAPADENIHVAEGHDASVLLRWGDPLFADSPAFNPYAQTVAAQERQFGYNNDYIGYQPLTARAGEDARGVLCVNHEYTSRDVMFPNFRDENGERRMLSVEELNIEMAAHGGSLVEIVRRGDDWTVDVAGRRNRRITARTPMTLTGPARGAPDLRTAADPSGETVLGTINNCAGGMTPWGTYLMAEENFHIYFTRDAEASAPGAAERRYGYGGPWGYDWRRADERFDIDAAPNEVNRFGWVVEVDPEYPAAPPRKHTALGRFKHEGATTTIARDGRAVVYMGDDQRGEYVYKFISRNPFDPDDRAANLTLLEDGDLYVACFGGAIGVAEGALEWRLLTAENAAIRARLSDELGRDVITQADVMTYARFAADALDATPMDRPEDIEPVHGEGRAFVMLTNNTDRAVSDDPRTALNPPNPLAENHFGHVIEIIEEGADAAALSGRWTILFQCGRASDYKLRDFHPDTTLEGRFGSPDNCAIDPEDRLWIATDQGGDWGLTDKSDGLYAIETEGALRGLSRRFFATPVGAELCGPYFTPEGENLFLSVQHPATDGVANYEPFASQFPRNADGVFLVAPYSSMDHAATHWPDFESDPEFNSANGRPMPPRPSVVVIRRSGGGRIG